MPILLSRPFRILSTYANLSFFHGEHFSWLPIHLVCVAALGFRASRDKSCGL